MTDLKLVKDKENPSPDKSTSIANTLRALAQDIEDGDLNDVQTMVFVVMRKSGCAVFRAGKVGSMQESVGILEEGKTTILMHNYAVDE